MASERRVWLFYRLAPTVVADVHKLELNLGEPALEVSPAEAAELFSRVTSN